MSPKTENPWDLGPPPRYNKKTSNDYMALPANRRHSHPGPVGWKHFEHPSPTGHFWSKSVRDPISSSPFQIHHSISKRQRDPNGPDCFFNCNLLPRTPDISKEDIAILCCSVASFARGHRGSSQGYCNCTFSRFETRKQVC